MPPNIYANTRDVLLGVIVLALLIAGFRWAAKPSSRPEVKEEYCLPVEITPFTVAALVHRIGSDDRITLSAQQRQELEQDLSAVERSYFVKAVERNALDLRSVADRWSRLARESVCGQETTHA